LPRRHLLRVSRLVRALLPAVGVVALAGCGSSGSGVSARALLRDTFAARHQVTSGRMSFALTVAPAGAGARADPVTVTVGGPFQSRGAGRSPASDFTLQVASGSQHGSLAIVSTGTAAFVTFAGTSYRLPESTFERFASGLSPLTAGGSLSSLGIEPLDWLVDPVVVGRATVGGVPTIHIRARVDPQRLVRELGALLSTTGSLAGGANSAGRSVTLSPASQRRIAGAIRKASVEIWTGVADRTLRRLTLAVTLPVAGGLSSLLGGLRSARLLLDVRYTDLNQAQRIPAPANARPFSELASALVGRS
jgi:hypothetical protein